MQVSLFNVSRQLLRITGAITAVRAEMITDLQQEELETDLTLILLICCTYLFMLGPDVLFQCGIVSGSCKSQTLTSNTRVIPR